jgi:hypothetical protein
MRLSAGLIGCALLLFGIQAGFSDGAEPAILPLPIGVAPVAIGAVVLLAGFLVGVVYGSFRYRVALALGMLGFVFATVGAMYLTIGGPGRRPLLTINEATVIAAVVLWLLALVVGVRALAAPRGGDQATHDA